MQFIDILAAFVALLTIAFAAWRYDKRPNFLVGVPPNSAEQSRKNITLEQFGRWSIVNRFQHKPDVLATGLRNKREFSKADLEKLFGEKLRCRDLILTKEGRSSLSIIVENKGERAARDYLMAIQLHNPGVYIIDVVTESSRVDCLYVSNPQLVAKGSKVPDRKIVKAYDDYRRSRELEGDAVFLVGMLESGATEMVCMEIAVDPNIDQFIVGFALDCSDFWVKKNTFFQGFKVIKSE